MKHLKKLKRKGIIVTKKSLTLPSVNALEEKFKSYGIDTDMKSIGNAIILLDCSGSMDGDKLVQAKKGTKEFILDAQKKNYFIGLISFGSFAKLISATTSNYYKIIEQLESLSVYGSTNLSEAIKLSYNLFNKTVANKVLVIVTDGMPDNADESLSEAQKIKNAGIDIITIGTDDADINFLKKIATRNDLVIPVQRENLASAISSASKLLPQNTKGE